MKNKNRLILLAIPLCAFIFASAFKSLNTNKVEERDSEFIVFTKEGFDKEDLLKDLRSEIGFNYRVVDTYNGLANGVLIKANKGHLENIKNLRSVDFATINQVLASYSEEKIFDSEAVYTIPLENDSIKDISAESKNKGENTLIAVLDSSFNIDHKSFVDLPSSVKTRLDKSEVETIASSSEFEAKNKTVSYINRKIPYVHDYGGSVTYKEPNYSNVEDSNVFSIYSNHGMHVSSIATANGEFKGIAPNAQLAFMKVFGDIEASKDQVCLDSYVASALNDAYLLGADAINMSFGSALNEFNEPTALEYLIDKINNTGSILSISAGNEGKGNWSKSGLYANNTTDIVEPGILGKNAVFLNGTSVASSYLGADELAGSYVALNGYTIEGNDQIINYSTSDKKIVYDKQLPFSSLIPDGKENCAIPYVVVPGVGKADDYNGIDVANKIAFVKRGDISFADKILTAKSKGAIGVIIANDTGLGSLGHFDLSTVTNHSLLIPTFGVGVEQGKALENAKDKVITISKASVSDFSSDGPVGDLRIKPDITSPGTNIAGAISYDEKNNVKLDDAYQYFSGTSMAAPNFSGAIAALIGEKEFANEEERIAYKKTLMNRIMSNADVLNEANGANVSVRRQGAGKVNVSRTLNSKIFLNTEDGKTKVELKNNDDITKGLIKFEVKVINESQYKGIVNSRLSVNVPEVTTLDSETYNSYKGVNFQTARDSSVKEILSKVELNGEKEQTITVSYQLSDSELKDIFAKFNNGTFIEGYFSLSSETDSTLNVNIPYLGFVGDYGKAPAVEAFDFEKEEGKVYQSDLLNSLFKDTGINLQETNYESCIVSTTGGLDAVKMDDILQNKVNIKKKYNPVTAELIDGVWHFYAGSVGFSDTIIIQQFVNRSVATNNIVVTKDGVIKPILIDHMFNSLGGGKDDYSLFKSMANASYIINGEYYLAARAYTIIPLEYDGHSYEPGKYNFTFNYTLLDGTVQTKKYVLVVDDSIPTIVDTSLNDDILKVKVSGNIFKVISGDLVASKEVSGAESIFTLDLSSVKNDRDKVFVQIIPVSGSSISGLVNLEEHHVFFANGLEKGYKAKLKETVVEGFDGSYTFYSISLYDENGVKQKFEGDFTFSFKFDEKYSKGVEVYKIDDGQLIQLNSILSDGSVLFASNSLTFAIKGISSGSNALSLPLIISIVGGAAVIAIVVATVLVLRKKKHNEK